MYSQPLKLSAISIALILGGCAAIEKDQARVSVISADALERVQKAKDKSEEQTLVNTERRTRELVDSPYFSADGKKPAPSARPPALDRRVELAVAEPISLSNFAALLSQLANLPIRLDADIGAEIGEAKLRPNFTGRVEDALKQVVGAMGLSTRVEDGALVVFRFETVLLRSKRAIGTYNTSSSIGVQGAATNSAGQGASGNSTVSSSVQGQSVFDPWKELGESIKASLTPQGKVAIMQASGQIVVTDTPVGVRRAERIVATDNQLATHPILVKMEVISVLDDNSNDLGVNWTNIFARIAGANSKAQFLFSSPAALSQGSVGTFKIDMGAVASGGNSDLLISALAETGKTATLLRREFTSLHNVPASIARTSSTSYRARVTASGTGSSTGATEPGVEPGSVTTGIKMFVTPTWVGNDDYVVTVTYDDSFLRVLRQLGAGKQQIDAPETESTQTFNVAQIKTGYTAVLNTLEIDENSVQARGLTESITTGKSGRGKKLRFFTLLTVAQGPY